MSVLRQLLLSVTVVIIVILTGTLVLSLNGTRDYLNTQLQADSDNAATSLALILSQPGNQDPVLRELLVTALFDSGQFQSIVLRDTQGQAVVTREVASVTATDAPAWFSQLLPLRTPQAIRQVSDGWTQVGELVVIADDSAARNILWSSGLRVFAWVALAGLLWLAFVVLLTRWLRRVLPEEIARQVDSIADGQSGEVSATRRQLADLMPAGHVIAHARERVMASKQEAVAKIESLTLELNHDMVTGVPNRRYFINELHRALQPNGDPVSASLSGYVLLARQRDLAAMAAALPRADVDAWLRTMGERLQEVLAEFPDTTSHLGRLNGSDFAVLLPDVQGPQALLIMQAVRRAVLDARIEVVPGRLCRSAFAMTDFTRGNDLSAVFARLDSALTIAESAGHQNIETVLRTEFGNGAPHGIVSETAWRSMLHRALAEDHLGLSVTKVSYGPSQAALDRYEATLSLADPQHHHEGPLSGFSFMPAAVRLGLSADFDMRAIRLGLEWLNQHTGELVVRVSAPSIVRPEFMASLKDNLGSGSNPHDRLIIELNAYALTAYPAEVYEVCRIAHQAGVRVGLRGVAQQLDAITRLQGLPLSYIKLGGGFMSDLDANQGSISLLNAVIHTAMALRLNVLVDEVPGEQAALLLHDHGALVRRN